MSDNTTRLNLPYLQASQADKHVTFNEVVSILDGLVMGAITARTVADPPATQSAGARYLLPANPIGAWNGHGGKYAYLQDGTWLFREPKVGWILYVEAEQSLIVFNGSSWRVIQGPVGPVAQYDQLAIGTPPDSAMPFNARLNNARFTARTTQDGGDGQVRLSLNRQDSSKSATLSFQTSGQSDTEVSLSGAGGLDFKVRNGANNWLSAASFSHTDGCLTLLPNGLSIGPIAIGHGAGANATNLGFGALTLQNLTTGTDCLAIGAAALESCTTGSSNCAIGRLALRQTTTGTHNVVYGLASGLANTAGSYNCAIGNLTMQTNTTGSDNAALGYAALASNTTGSQNSAFGLFSLYSNTNGAFNTAVGRYAMSTGASYVNCSALGHNAQVTGNNQVQLGDSAATVYVYGTVQNRSDARDKVDIRDTVHGLKFIRALRPVDFRWNLRETYGPITPTDPRIGGKIEVSDDVSDALHKKGTKKRKRFHSGLVAQEVQAVLKAHGVDFGGFQDHARAGGKPVMTLGYDEFIAPLIKSIQELADDIDCLKTHIRSQQ
jgi:hypothetical protein